MTLHTGGWRLEEEGPGGQAGTFGLHPRKRGAMMEFGAGEGKPKIVPMRFSRNSKAQGLEASLGVAGGDGRALQITASVQG